MNRKAYEKLDYTLGLIAAAADGKNHGCIVNSFHQVTSSLRAKFTVTLNKENETTKAVLAAGSFAITLLSAEADSEIVNTFGYKSGRVQDKFEGREVFADKAGNPYLKDGMVSRISCKVVDQLDIGNFVLLVGEVTEAEVLDNGGVLTLKAFSERGRIAPSNATVIRTMESNSYRCVVCGYVHEAESIPEDFKCPICRAPAKRFVKQD